MWMLLMSALAMAAEPCVFDTDAFDKALLVTHPSVKSAHHVTTDRDERGARTHLWTAVLSSGESLTVQGGGCDHLGLQATLYIPASLSPPPLSDTKHWVARAQKLPELVSGLASTGSTLSGAELSTADGKLSAMLPVEPGWGEFVVEAPSQGGVLLSLSMVVN